jgi:hypothetical protein
MKRRYFALVLCALMNSGEATTVVLDRDHAEGVRGLEFTGSYYDVVFVYNGFISLDQADSSRFLFHRGVDPDEVRRILQHEA